MLNIRSIGHLNIVVSNITEAVKYYSELFEVKVIASLPHLKNEGMATNMGLEGVEISEVILKFSKCNLVLGLVEFHNPKGREEIISSQINDMGGPRHIGLNVENVDIAFDYLKSRSDIEILNSSSFRPVTYSKILPEQFHFHDEKAEKNLPEKERLAELLSKKKCFYFRDQYGVIWEIEERFFEN